MSQNVSSDVNGALSKSKSNEMEILVFTIKDQVFGVNVDQVREILMPSAVDKVPHGHPCVEGVYMPRDVLITVINLADYLGIYPDEEERTLFIVADVERMNAAFRVNNVLGIERIYVNTIEKAETSFSREGVMAGIVRVEGKLISLINFAEIVADIAP